MRLNEILYENEYTCNRDVKDLELKSITTNPNNINSNTLFILLKSINFDVNKILNYIIIKKPKIIVCEPDITFQNTDIPILNVKNSRAILPFIYSRFYQINFEKIKFIGITGTNGKTTTATILSHILKSSGRKTGFIGTGKISINGITITNEKYSMTTPDPEILYESIKKMENDGCEYVVMEVSSHALYFDKILPIKFKIAIFTNFSSEHLDFHKTIEEYWNSKAKLFSQSEKAILNVDDDRIFAFTEGIKCEYKTVGIQRKAHVTAKKIISVSLEKSEFIYKENDTELKIKLNIGGDYNIYNALLATSAAIELGIKEKDIESAYKSFSGVRGRLEIINSEITVIIDYAHSAEAFKTLLKTVNKHKKDGQNLITVFGCGGNRDKTKRPLMAKYAEEFSSFSIVTSDNPRCESEKNIIKEIIGGFKNSASFRVISSRKKAIYEAINIAKKNDIVLLIGKGAEPYNIDKTGYHSFDEKSIIKEALKKRLEKFK